LRAPTLIRFREADLQDLALSVSAHGVYVQRRDLDQWRAAAKSFKGKPAALEQLEAEKQRRLQAKVDAGEIVLVPLAVVVGETEADIDVQVAEAKAQEFEITTIVTGVPRNENFGTFEPTSAPAPFDRYKTFPPASDKGSLRSCGRDGFTRPPAVADLCLGNRQGSQR
jgi:hypothetical protein